MSPVFDTTEPFYGTLYLSEWIQSPNGVVKAIRGTISVYTDEAAVGFRNRSGSNWLAIVRGPETEFVLLGCQIRGFLRHGIDFPSVPDLWVVA